MILDWLEHWRRHVRGKACDQAFEFLPSMAPETPGGGTRIRGWDLHAGVVSCRAATREEARFESHQRPINVSLSLVINDPIDGRHRELLRRELERGAQDGVTFEVTPAAPIEPTIMDSGRPAVLFPEHVRMPKLITDHVETVKNVVVIVRGDRV